MNMIQEDVLDFPKDLSVTGFLPTPRFRSLSTGFWISHKELIHLSLLIGHVFLGKEVLGLSILSSC